MKNIKTYPKIYLEIAEIHSRTSSTETLIVPEMQQINGSFLLQTPSYKRQARRKKTLKIKKKLKNGNSMY